MTPEEWARLPGPWRAVARIRGYVLGGLAGVVLGLLLRP